MTNKMANKIKSVYSAYHGGLMTAEEALYELELFFAESNE
jgi:hypothetical protein